MKHWIGGLICLLATCAMAALNWRVPNLLPHPH